MAARGPHNQSADPPRRLLPQQEGLAADARQPPCRGRRPTPCQAAHPLVARLPGGFAAPLRRPVGAQLGAASARHSSNPCTALSHGWHGRHSPRAKPLRAPINHAAPQGRWRAPRRCGSGADCSRQQQPAAGALRRHLCAAGSGACTASGASRPRRPQRASAAAAARGAAAAPVRGALRRSRRGPLPRRGTNSQSGRASRPPAAWRCYRG